MNFEVSKNKIKQLKSNMELKTKQTKKILEPLQYQINELQLLLNNVIINSSDVLLAKSKLFEKLNFLVEKFESLTSYDNYDNNEETNTKFTDMPSNSKHISLLKDIDELITDIKISNIDECVVKDITDLLLNKFILVLKALEDLECLPLKQRIQDCFDYVKEMSIANEIEDFQNIKELGTSILEILEPLRKYRRSLVSTLLSEKLSLYICQLCISFDMLIHLAQEQHRLNAPIYGCKKYVCERICTCCEMLLELFNDGSPSLKEEVSARENHFVYRMDLALDIILEMPSKTRQEQLSECGELWLTLENVFSHAMAITQVCQPYNFKAITGSCQSIVLEYEKLKQQLLSEVPDPALNTLFMNTLTDALYRLERKINIAVLTLSMEVFSNPYTALKRLVMTCGNSLNAKRRSKSDLNNLIEDFDQLFDQTVQIGMFTIACCKDTNRNSKIRNCLAGFESLETELISAITSFYLHPDSKEMRSSVKLLTAQWQLEMNKFHNAVNLVINSAAFCQVILDDLQERITAISDCLDNRQSVTQFQVQEIVQRASTLSSQITATVNDIGNENIERHTIMMIRELKAAIFEANAASKTLLVAHATEPQQLRVIKRCELILNVVQRLQPALSIIMNNTIHDESGIGQGDTTRGSSSHTTNSSSTVCRLYDENSLAYIKTPYSVKVCKPQLSIQPANSKLQKPSDLSCLLSYIKSGRTLRNEHSIMYNTSHKSKDVTMSAVKEMTFRNLSSIRQHLFSRDSFAIHTNIDISEESIDVTAILENITSLSASSNTIRSFCLSSKIQNTIHRATKKDILPNTKDKLIGNIRSETESCLNKSGILDINECTISGGGDASFIEACQKLNNVKLSNDKTRKSGQREVQ